MYPFYFFALLLAFTSCGQNPKKTEMVQADTASKSKVPQFNETAAYNELKKQVAYGPRVPGTEAHQRCGDYLYAYLQALADTVMEQTPTVTLYTGKQIRIRNLIASFNPSDTERILLCAHWDTRPFADNDSSRQNEPILGANDGASGAAVLLEIARQIKLSGLKKGIDIVFFDAEDWGKSGVNDSYCLGSQYWSKNPHLPKYKADFGILLDMVGAPEASFGLEANSERFAKDILHEVWRMGHTLGYSEYFHFIQRPGIMDDHYYINRNAGIPTIDIVQYDMNSHSGFASYWHTHRDNMDNIDSKTLKAVGQTVMEVIWRK